jgi:hypothetical protein
MYFLPSSKSNWKIDGNQIAFGSIDFQPHPPTLAQIFASLDREVDLTIGSINFRVGSLGSVCLSDLENSGPSPGKTSITATSETLVGSSIELNSPVSIKPTKESTVEELDEIMENLDLDKSLGYSNMSSDENLNSSHNYSEKGFHGLLRQYLQQF